MDSVSRPEHPQDGPGGPAETDGLGVATIDPVLARRLSAIPDRVLGVPIVVVNAQETPSKQFQLWDVKRDEFMDPTEDRDRLSAPRIYENLEGRPEIPRFRPEATYELMAFTLTSDVAHKAFKGLRALVKFALRKPFKKSDD